VSNSEEQIQDKFSLNSYIDLDRNIGKTRESIGIDTISKIDDNVKSINDTL